MLDEEKRAEIFSMVTKKSKEKTDSPPVSETVELVKDLHNAAVVERVRSDEEYQKKFFDAAARTIDNEIESLRQEAVKRRQKTTYDANEEACSNYGIKQDVELWKIKMMKIGSGFWFIIYWVIASVTIVPLNVFFKGINEFIHNTFIAFLFGVIAYLIIFVGIPLLLTLTG